MRHNNDNPADHTRATYQDCDRAADYKPDSVISNHLSRRCTRTLFVSLHPLAILRWRGMNQPNALLYLAPHRVCPVPMLPPAPVRSYRTFSPLPPILRLVAVIFCGTFHGLAPSRIAPGAWVMMSPDFPHRMFAIAGLPPTRLLVCCHGYCIGLHPHTLYYTIINSLSLKNPATTTKLVTMPLHKTFFAVFLILTTNSLLFSAQEDPTADAAESQELRLLSLSLCNQQTRTFPITEQKLHTHGIVSAQFLMPYSTTIPYTTIEAHYPKQALEEKLLLPLFTSRTKKDMPYEKFILLTSHTQATVYPVWIATILCSRGNLTKAARLHQATLGTSYLATRYDLKDRSYFEIKDECNPEELLMLGLEKTTLALQAALRSGQERYCLLEIAQ